MQQPAKTGKMKNPIFPECTKFPDLTESFISQLLDTNAGNDFQFFRLVKKIIRKELEARFFVFERNAGNDVNYQGALY